MCKEAETEFAIEAADRALRAWSQTTAKHRSEVVNRWYQLVVEHKEDLATLITLEEGKPLSEARGEIDYAASFLQWFAEEAKRVRGDVIPATKPSQRILAGGRRHALGGAFFEPTVVADWLPTATSPAWRNPAGSSSRCSGCTKKACSQRCGV